MTAIMTPQGITWTTGDDGVITVHGVADCPQHGLHPAWQACPGCLDETAEMVGEISRAPVVTIGGAR